MKFKYFLFLLLATTTGNWAKLEWPNTNQVISEQPRTENVFSKSWNNLKSFTWPDNFMWGVATSARQIEGDYYDGDGGDNLKALNCWTMHSECTPGQECTLSKKLKHKKLDKKEPNKNPLDTNKFKTCCDHWHRYKEDVQLIKNAGLNSYRLSVDWAKIQPTKNNFDSEALKHYSNLIDELTKNNIKPIVCLFHHSWPQWFEEAGAFEKKENIYYFVQFADAVYRQLDDCRIMWMTFNEPVGYAFEGYFRGHYPPYKKSLMLCGQVVKNMLDAHVKVRKLFKEHDKNVEVGFPHIFQFLDPYNSYNPFDQLICKTFNYLLIDAALNYFKTGEFGWLGMVGGKNKDAVGALDFLGINYYSHTIISNFGSTERDDELHVGGRAIYPEGLERAINKAHEFAQSPAFKENGKSRLKLHIGENGINDAEDKYKDLFFTQHLEVVKKAIERGIKIDGFFVWTLMDSLSWKKGTDSAMGIYNVNRDTQERTMYPGAKNMVAFFKSQTEKLTA